MGEVKIGNKTTTTASQSPAPQAMQAYSNLINNASSVASQPYTPYTGVGVASTNAEQNTGVGNINNYAFSAQPDYQLAGGYIQGAAQPLTTTQIQNYENPYTQDVVNATQAQFNNQNAQQLQGVKGNAIAQGALGGNREAVAEAETTNQQNLAQAPVIAGLENTGYNTAVQTAMQQYQQNPEYAATALAGVGAGQQTAGLSGAEAQYGVGTSNQAYAAAPGAAPSSADVAYNYQQYLNKLAYPYQNLAFEAGIDTGAGSLMGGTSQTTTPAPSIFSQIAGLGTGALGLAALAQRGGRVGVARGGSIPGRHYVVPEHVLAHLIHRAWGGGIASFDSGGVASTPYSGGVSYVPTMQITHGSGAPKPPSPPQQQSNIPQAGQIGSFAKAFNKTSAGDSLQDNIEDIEDGTTFSGDWRGGAVGPSNGIMGYADGGSPQGDIYDEFTPPPSDPAFILPPGLNGIAAPPNAPSGVDSGAVPLPLPRPNNIPEGVSGPTQIAGDDTDKPLPEAPDLGSPVQVASNDDTSVGVAAPPPPAASTPMPPTNVPAPIQGPYGGVITRVADQNPSGYSPSGLKRAIQIESSFNPNAVSGSYVGLGQFGPQEWQKYGNGQSRTNPIASIEATQAYAADNGAVLESRIGRPPSDFEKYLAHQQGAGGAAALLTHPEMRAGDIVGDSHISSNGGNPNAPAGDFVRMWRAKFDQQPGDDSGVHATAYSGEGGHGRGLGISAALGTDASETPAEKSHGVLNPLNLSPDAATALAAAGFRMAASQSPFFATGIGEGGLSGMQTYSNIKQQERAERMSQRKIDQESQKLKMEWQKHLDEMHQKDRPFNELTADQKANRALEYEKMHKPVLRFNNEQGQELVDPYSGLPVTPTERNSFREPGENLSPVPPQSKGTNVGYTPVSDNLPEGLKPVETPYDEEYLSSYDKDTANLIRGVANYEINPLSISGKTPPGGGLSRREFILGKARRYTNNAYDQTLYNAKQKAVNDFLAGTSPQSSATVMTAGSTAILHASELYDLVDKVKSLPPEQQTWFASAMDGLTRGANAAGIPWGSYAAQAIKNSGLKGTPQGELLQQWADAKQRYSEEVTRFYSGGNGSEAERDRSLNLLNPNLSKEELKGAIARDIKMLNDKVTTYNSRLMAGMHPAAWKAALRQDPELVTVYKNSREARDRIQAAEAERMKASQGNRAAPSLAPAMAPAGLPAGIPPGSKSGKKGGVRGYMTPDGTFIPAPGQ